MHSYMNRASPVKVDEQSDKCSLLRPGAYSGESFGTHTGFERLGSVFNGSTKSSPIGFGTDEVE